MYGLITSIINYLTNFELDVREGTPGHRGEKRYHIRLRKVTGS